MRLIVIGAGLAGLTTAYYLQRDGVDVTVLDRAAGPGLETSFANGALLHPSLAEPWNAPGIFWDVLKWIGREDAPMLLRPQALPDLLGWGIRFLRNSSPRAFALNARKNLNLAIYSLQMMQRRTRRSGRRSLIFGNTVKPGDWRIQDSKTWGCR